MEMQTTAIIFAALLACSGIVSAQGQQPSSEVFRPFQMTGEWNFINDESGRKYSGDVILDVQAVDGAGKMRGTVSFDGRQTNDNCSTRGIFSDVPVAADISKITSGYNVTFALKCSKGDSPRTRVWELTCEKGVCTHPEVLPHGKGVLTLKSST